MQNYQIFQGLKVLELAGVLAGPAVGQFFAELGAEVVKVENSIGGDVTRSWRTTLEAEKDDVSAYFSAVNWGKKSVAVNLREATYRKLIQELSSKADVVITSFRPGDSQNLGLSYKDVSRMNPKVVYGAISGYPAGSLRAGYDAVIQAESGFMHLNRIPGAPPQKMPVAFIDLLAAHQLKEGLLLALYQRQQSGKGSCVEVNLLESALASLANQATNYFVTHQEPQPLGSSHPNIVPYGTAYRTNDNRELILAIGNDRQFKDLCEVLQLTLHLNERYITNPLRVQNRLSLESILKEAIVQRDSNSLLIELEKKGVPAGLIKLVSEALEDAQVSGSLHKSLFATGLRQSVFSFNGDRGKSLSTPPSLGENTKDVLLSWLGYEEPASKNSTMKE